MLRSHHRDGLILLGALLAGACSDGGSGPPVPSVLSVAAPLAATAAAGSTVSPGVRVSDDRQRPVPGVQVTFEVTAGGGSVANATATTDANGIASAGAWTLGTAVGENRLVASHGSLPPLAITVTGTAGPAAAINAISAVDLTGFAGSPVSPSPAVRVLDQHGNPVQGVTVTFAVTGGGGSLTGATQVTNSSGSAAVGSWTLGDNPGPNTLTATFAGGSTVTFNAAGQPGTGPQLAKFAGDDTTCPINVAGCVFAVRYTVNGVPTAGETITWANGTGTTIVTTTDARGIASAGNIPPNSAAGARTQTATASTGQQITFDYSLVAGGGYDIEIRYMGAMPSAAVQAAFDAAVARWQEVITGDLPNEHLVADSADCGMDHPAIDETIDDLLVLVLVDSIDGDGSTLGSAGACFIRGSLSDPGPPLLSSMRLDSADLADLASSGGLADVILHELGHTLGFPQLWDLGSFDLLQDTAGNPHYTGARAGAPFVIAGGTLISGIGVPVENTGGPGTRLGHWRESVLSNELMTGFISGSNNPLSAITIGSLMDLGYQVNFGAADAYILPGAGMPAVSAPLIELRELPMPRPRIAH